MFTFFFPFVRLLARSDDECTDLGGLGVKYIGMGGGTRNFSLGAVSFIVCGYHWENLVLSRSLALSLGSFLGGRASVYLGGRPGLVIVRPIDD